MPKQNVPLRVIIADDHVLIRLGIKRILSRQNDVTIIGEVGSGEELLGLLGKVVPELLILDISMPKINGIELTEKLKQRHPEMKILILTMHKTKHHFFRSMTAGADGYLIKSDSDRELSLAIEKIREDRTYISPQLAKEFAEDLLDICRNPQTNPFRDLTKRERQILQLVVDGHTSKSMAAELHLSPRTVDHHRSNLLKKFNMKNSVDLVHFAVKNGYVSLD